MRTYYKKLLKKWAHDLFPVNRSLTGDGNRFTIKYIKKNINSKFLLKKVKSGKKVFSWFIPKEWEIKKAILKDENGNIISNFQRSNLEVLGYSSPINKELTYKELKPHLYTSQRITDAIPYVTSYYKKNWGFCLPYKKFLKLNKKIKYKATIESRIFNGYMNYTEMIIPGESKKEIILSSYICHPSMANNELSGILAISLLSKMLKKNKFSIRLILMPETIGAIYYINKNLNKLKKNLVAGFNLSCVGIEAPYTLISSANENTYADIIVNRIGKKYKNFKKISFLKRGSNERQFGCQNLGLPFVTITRKKFGEYKEYHTSKDNLKILNYNTIIDTCFFMKKTIDEINKNLIFEKKTIGEPHWSKYNLVSSEATMKNMLNKNRHIMSHIAALTNRNHDVVSLSKKISASPKKISKIIKILEKNKILKRYI
jgi:aminopeptidase-like protein